MKTKQGKEEVDKSIDEDPAVEPKTRARKKASDIAEEEKTKPDEPKTSKEPKRSVNKPRAIVRKKPLGIRKTLRSKKVIATKEKLKNVIKGKRGRKPAIKVDLENQSKETVPLIPASEIKKEPQDDTSPGSRSSSPKTAGRRPRQSSDIAIMKSVLGDSPTIVHGPRSPYSMRSERSNSPSLSESKNLRSSNPRKAKKLLTEVVIKEQNKRRRLPSEPKADSTESIEDCKKKRLRSCSREGSEISKCSDYTESDISLSETMNDTDKELNKKLDKAKTDLDVDIENNLQISTIDKVPSMNMETKLAGSKPDTEPISNLNEKNKRKLSLKRSVSSDSDNNNSNKIKLDSLNQTSSDVEDKLLEKTENVTLLDARSSILTSMSKTFNSKELSKNIRKARRGKKAAAAAKPSPTKPTSTITTNTLTSTITNDSQEPDDKHETLESLSKEINDIINNLDQNIEVDQESDMPANTQEPQTKTPSKFYGLSKPLGDNNSIITPETPVKDKDVVVANETTPMKNDDSENIRLRYEDSVEKCKDGAKPDVAYKCSTVASIDKLMDRLKEFEEFDKRRNRQESESKSGDEKSVMVSNDVVLINKSGADIKPFKDIQARSPEKPVEKENFLSCFVNNSAISIVKMDHARKSVDVDRPNAITLIKRNSISSRKESTSSNHSKEVSDSDAISLFEKSLGKDVTLTKKTSDKSSTPAQIDLHHFASIQPNNSTHTLAGVMLDSSQISITPRVADPKVNNSGPVTKRNSISSESRKSSECITDSDEKIAAIEKIKTPPPQVIPAMSNTPVAVKSPEAMTPVEKEALGPPLENIKAIPEDISLASDISKLTDTSQSDPKVKETKVSADLSDAKPAKDKSETVEQSKLSEEQSKIPEKQADLPKTNNDVTENKIQTPEKQVSEIKIETPTQKTEVPKKKIELKRQTKSAEKQAKTPENPPKQIDPPETPKSAEKIEEVPKKMDIDDKPENKIAIIATQTVKTGKSPEKSETKARRRSSNKSARNSIESLPGPSSAIHETPESQKRKENILRTLGLLTHKAAKEAKIEKLKEKERILEMGGIAGKKKSQGNQDYTGTLKTVIKLSRASGDREKKRHRSSLKMTFQKSKHRSGKPTPEVGETEADDAFYTIERREGATAATSDGGLRKHHSNRLNNDAEIVPEPEAKETLNLVIPEKASSFSIHPGRLCMDQCFYCGGKFGLFDTPCHIAQMKSSERQKKVLLNEEKLTIDSCLCDACYRHVDRRANCPSYRKRPAKPVEFTAAPLTPVNTTPAEKPPSPLEDESSEEGPVPTLASGRPASCHTAGCCSAADHSIRRKWLIKMRTSVNQVLKLQGDYPGLHTIPLCGDHYRSLSKLMCCALCRRRITKHHNVHFLHHGFQEINPLLREAHIPVTFAERPVLCKICKDYCCHLLKPEKSGNAVDQQSVAYYTRKLLQIYNIEVPNELNVDTETPNTSFNEDGTLKQKKKIRIKTKSPKTVEPEKLDESSDKTESSPEKDGGNKTEPMEEDIESLISSNKILVPGAKSIENKESDGSESDVYDLDVPTLPHDKQTELQYLLQKQNNPAQFLPTANLTQKQKNLHKIQHGVQKPGQLHRIVDKNAKRLHKLGQFVVQKEKSKDVDVLDAEKHKDGLVIKNITLNEECTIESVPNKRPTDINTLKNKWQMSESFSQVKKNLSELSKKLDKDQTVKKISEKFSNPVRRLETNPSISVRELFPGEEEMNLQCNVEFNNVKGVTPEGWEKCNTTIQYDVETKKMWNELQRPYGNQSSFLRHLVLLEKYFRSGDLVLAHNATPNASNYSDSVQSRLRAYDNVVNDTPRRSEPQISLIEFRKKPSVNGKSLLKSNQIEEPDPKKVMPPPPKPKPKVDKVKKNLPPELIAINTPNAQGRKAIQNVLHNIQQLVKGVSASDPTEVAASPVPVPPPMPIKIEPPKEKKEVKTDTPKKSKPTSKPWRPTLMPITQENISRIEREPKQVAVDGRSLPSLVQVMSSGKRYHITLQDYNKMCVMRREKLQQLHDGETKTKRPSIEETTLITEIQPSTMLGNGGTMTQNISVEDRPKDMPELTSNAANILKNVGLKNITIAPIPLKTATVTSQTLTCPIVSSPSLLVTSTPIRIPQLGPSVSITTETVLTPNLPIMTSSAMIMPKIPKSLTVIPQTVVANVPQSLIVQSLNPAPASQAVIHTIEGPRP